MLKITASNGYGQSLQVTQSSLFRVTAEGLNPPPGTVYTADLATKDGSIYNASKVNINWSSFITVCKAKWTTVRFGNTVFGNGAITSIRIRIIRMCFPITQVTITFSEFPRIYHFL